GRSAAGAPAAFGVVLVGLAVEQVVHHRDHQQGQQGGDEQPADHGDRHRRTHLGAWAAEQRGQRQRHEAEHRGQRGHHDRAQARAGAFDQRLALGHAGLAQLVDLVDQDDRVLDHQADQQDQADNTTTEIGEPVSSSAAMAPTRASGMVNRMTNGCSRDSNCEAITRYTRNTARPKANSSERTESSSSSPWPPMRISTSVPIGFSATIRCTSATAVPRSIPRRLADTIATRRWSARWISLGPVVETMSATDDSSTGLE